MKYSDKILTDVLSRRGFFLAKDLENYAQKSQAAGESLRAYLVREGLIKEEEILNALCMGLNLESVSLKNKIVDKALIARVPVRFAWYYKFVPLSVEGRVLTLAVASPLDVKIQDEIRAHLGLEPKMVLTTEADLNNALTRYYGLAADTIDRILTREPGKKSGEFEIEGGIEDLEKKSEDASVTKIVNEVILQAYQKRATDIHIEPYRNKVRIRYRIDGVMVDANLPAEVKHFLLPMISRIKIMANLSIVEKRLPQDGSAVVKTREQDVDLRVSTIPTPRGESMVIRLLPSKVMLFSLEKLGIESGYLSIFRELLQRPHGIIFVTGPTGSGKTTTLYACLNEINSTERKIITIEDPIEYEMENITQIQVNLKVDLDFARGLRSILRHDPDIIMVGEVRDLETAEIAIRTALTGHLVFSTLHTNDAASGITRLVDMGVEPFLVASSVEAFVAQRLLRIICPKCKEEVKEPLSEIKAEMIKMLRLPEGTPIKIYRGKGCDYCNNTGYYGRTAIYEILLVNEAIRNAILDNRQVEHIKQIAVKAGMITLRQSGWQKVREGITTPAEVMNVTTKENILFIEEKTSPYRPSPEPPNPESNEYSSRIYPRTMAKVSIRYKIGSQGAKMQVPFLTEGVEQSTVTEDISAGGLRFISRSLISFGTILELKIQLDGEPRSIDCFAKVFRVEQGHFSSDLFQIAVCYLDISNADRAKIANFVTARLKDDGKAKTEPR